jgi:hypothetical protein
MLRNTKGHITYKNSSHQKPVEYNCKYVLNRYFVLKLVLIPLFLDKNKV